MTPALHPRSPWRGRRILLGVGGGIASYKSVGLARTLTRLGAEVDVILTAGGGEFLRPLVFEGVTGRAVHTDLFSTSGAALHLRLGVDADVVCIAPATADLLARYAGGRADDLLATTLLATRAPVLLAPAMNDRMHAHPAVRANLASLASFPDVRILGPEVGPLAFGEGEGPGRMVEPELLVEEIGRALRRGKSALQGRRVLVTAGPTREAVDPVRYLGNRSSGRMGFALAAAAWRRGAEVLLISGPVERPTPVGVERIDVESAGEMFEVVRKRRPEADLSIFAAAVADFRPRHSGDAKLKREKGLPPPIELVANPDVAGETRSLAAPGSITVGFALETERVEEHAAGKRVRKGFDLIVANPAGEEGAGFGAETNRGLLIGETGEVEPFGTQSKEDLAERILDRAEEILRERGRG